MKTASSGNFIAAAEIAMSTATLQTALKRGTGNAYGGRMRAMSEFGLEHGETMRQQAAKIRRHALRNLPELLEQAEKNLTAKGVTVLWAQDAVEANLHVIEIARRHEVKRIAKSKSMVTEEIGLNPQLEAEGLQVVETDLGEFIVQISGSTPSHIIMPVMHMTRELIGDLFVQKLNMEPTHDAKIMTKTARKHLREIFLQADMGISGGNFVVAETGSVCLVSNEGNIDLVTTKPQVHVAIVGIEKVIPTLADYATLTQILPRSGTGQRMAVYTQMINAPRRPEETDGPEHVYVIFLDNGRSEIYASDYTEALACIRCGACLNACPVYQSVGGHAYGWVYPGPIGAVLTPLMMGLENAAPLPQASSLCGKCKQVCPVDIDLPQMLLQLRRDSVEQKLTDAKWNWGIWGWSLVNRSPRLFQWAGKLARFGKNRLFRKNFPPPLNGWTKYRDFPDFAPQSFHELWAERQKK